MPHLTSPRLASPRLASFRLPLNSVRPGRKAPASTSNINNTREDARASTGVRACVRTCPAKRASSQSDARIYKGVWISDNRRLRIVYHR
ncbi:uncharacterized protein PSFLO_03283 [Pseudozyma flocculosa]|uniref:Uncharacterized protein n=1 Tax=Pseudozyma flocculosa TaxID=84751 RepID=A0A5C3F251_9BASI|nr:uncharacterized protein PSFLO_03283 [Pseudozyma flocculosa]